MKARIIVTALTLAVLVSAICFVSGAGMYITLPKGTIQGAYVTYKDSDTITVKAGYGECNGNYWEVTGDTDHDMTSLAAGDDWHYIYIDDDGSTYPDPNIYDSTTEPSYSDAKLGWYSSDDRCIGVVHGKSSQVCTFYTNGTAYLDDTGFCALVTGDPNGSLTFAEATAYTPVNTTRMLVCASNSDTADSANIWVAADGTHTSIHGRYAASYDGQVFLTSWLEVPKGSSRDLWWQGEDDDNNTFLIVVSGYQIER